MTPTNISASASSSTTDGMATRLPTTIAQLTPPGMAAVAVLQLRGPDAWRWVRELFRPAGPALPETPTVGRIRFGTLGHPPDQVLIVATSDDPVPTVEIHCHGGLVVVDMLIEQFVARGAVAVVARVAEQFAEATTPTRQQAAERLPHARTVRTASIILDQVHGAFDRAVAEVVAAAEAGQMDGVRAKLARLVALIPAGLHTTWPFRVVVAGSPNAGKSSLINALAGYSRSIVSDTPGTTRDVLSTPLVLHGWPVDLFDTAGLRATSDQLEAAGVALARQALLTADLVIHLFDQSQPLPAPDPQLEQLALAVPRLRVASKADLPAVWSGTEQAMDLAISITDPPSLLALQQRIVDALLIEPRPGEGVPLTRELADWLRRVYLLAQQTDDAAAVLAELRQIPPG